MKKLILMATFLSMILIAYAEAVTIEQYSSELLTGIKTSINTILEDAELRTSEKNLVSNIELNKVTYSKAMSEARAAGKEADRLLEIVNRLRGISKETKKKKVGGKLELLIQAAKEG